jgi:hypothetical protein
METLMDRLEANDMFLDAPHALVVLRIELHTHQGTPNERN